MLSSLNGLTHLLASSLLASSFAAPVAWSPNGQWLAYAITDGGSTSLLSDGWLTPSDPAAPPLAAAAAAPPRPSTIHRVWASRFGAAPESVLIEESAWPLSSPTWSADGRSLIFGRFVPASHDADPTLVRGRYEAVVQSGLDQKKVVVVVPDLSLQPDELAEIIHLKPEISPDGRHLATPRPGKKPGLVIVRLDTGAVLKTIEGARSPSWAPDGLRLLYVDESQANGGKTSRTFHVLNRDLAAPRAVPSDLVVLDAPPVWALDGQSILAIAQPPPALTRNVQLQVDLYSVGVGGASTRPMITLESMARMIQPGQIHGRLLPPRGGMGAAPTVVRTSFSLDREQNECIAMVEIGGQPQALRWCNIRNQRVSKMLNPLDLKIMIGAAALSPDGQTVAFRAEAPGMLGLPAFCDLNTETVALVAPDASTRRVWLELLAARSVDLLKIRPEPAGGRAPTALATILPPPTALIGVDPVQTRIRRLARFAGDLLNQPPPADAVEPPSPRDLAARDEIRLFFDYLRGDFRAAETRLDAVAARADDPGARLRWLGLRAQVLLGQGQVERARGIAAYISRATRVRAFHLDETPAGPVVTTIRNPDADWAAQLALSLSPGSTNPGDGRIGLDPAEAAPDSPNFPEPDPFLPQPIGGQPPFPLLPNAPEPAMGGFDPGQFGGRMLVEPPAPRFLPDPNLDPPHGGLVPPRL